MSHLLLSHLSRDNNRPELVQELFEREARGTKIVIASRDQETEVYAIEAGFCGEEAPAGVDLRAAYAPAGAAGDVAVAAVSVKKRKALAAGQSGIVQGSLF